MKEGKTCKICGKTFTRRNYMQKHMEHIHSKRYSCPKCFRFFSGPTEHSCTVENGRFLCYVRDCNLRFSNGMAMRLHIRDCHRKVDEEGVGEVMKSKKGVRELIQTLCKKINLLNNCFDELKYQVDTITSFLHSKNFGFENAMPITVKAPPTSNKANTDVQSELEIKDEYEDVDYIDEEYEDEELSPEQGEQEEKDEDSIIFCDSNEGNNRLDPLGPIAPTTGSTIQPPELQRIISLTTAPTTPANVVSTKTSSQILVKRPAHVVTMPQKTTIGSTVITQIPAAHIVQIQESTIRKKAAPSTVATSMNVVPTKRKATSTLTKPTKNDSPTPPLFLKIQYDPETTICETDPKITFHFDTKPPDES